MYFIVDCLNYLAQNKELGLSDSHGETFRFHSWELVWSYKPIAKYQKSNFQPGRFVGIAWNHDNAFTYKIWTMSDGDWTIRASSSPGMSRRQGWYDDGLDGT